MSEMTPADTAAAPAAPAEAAQPNQPAAPKANPQEELDAVLKRLGGLEVKAGGKAHKVDSVEKLMRYAQRGLPVEESLQQLAQQRSQLEPMRALMEQLQGGDDEAAEAALEKLLDGKRFEALAEKRLRRVFEREQQMAQLTPRERELAAELERERGERGRLAAERKAMEERQRAEVEQREVAQLKGAIGTSITKALETMGLPPRLEPLAVEFMKPVIRATLEAGMPLEPAFLAEKVAPLFEDMLSYRAKSLEGEALLKFFGDDVGRKYRKALLGQLNGGGAKAAPAAQSESKSETQSQGGKWDPRRMF